MSSKIEYRIYVDEIDNPNYTDGAELWPVGTAQRLADAISAQFPSVKPVLVHGATGTGSGFAEDCEDAAAVEALVEKILA